MIDQDDLRRRANLPKIVESYGVVLTRKGDRWEGLCPFHEDSTPSFSVYRTKDGVARCGCFACHWDEDVFGFIGKIENLAAFREQAARVVDLIGDTTPMKTKAGRTLATYPYVDAEGRLLFEVLRRAVLDEQGAIIPGKKTFSQRRPDGKGGYIHNLQGVTRPLYRLPAVLQAETVWLAEGEKDCATLEALGAVASTNAGGAGKWELQYTEALRGRHIILCADTDAPGVAHAALIIKSIQGTAASIRVLKLPDGCKDITEYIEAVPDATISELLAMTILLPSQPPSAPPGVADPEQESTSDWRTYLITNRERSPRPLLANALTALRRHPAWRGVLALNEFSGEIHARRAFPGCGESYHVDQIWTDTDDTRLAEWLHHEEICVTPEAVGRAVQLIAEDYRFHPVREYLQGLQWDSTPRLDNWLIDYLGAAPSNYAAAAGSRWLISAVARAMQPGCKADCCLILEGEQGALKSTALRVLSDPWFSDEISDLGSKDSAIDIRGVWLIELSELDSLNRGDVARVKAFIARSVDHYRPPYGKRAVNIPRQCVFAGSTNQDVYLKDDTGNRRFWPVKCGAIDISALRADRDQLWAEAYLRYTDGAVWWLNNPGLIAEAEMQQNERYEGDPWEQRIADWLAQREDVSINQILDLCIAMPTERWNQLHKARVARCLRSLHWVRYRASDTDGSREWRYRMSYRLREERELF